MGFIEIILLISCLCLGIRTISDTDKLLGPTKDWLALKLPLFIWMPTIGCVTCMASFWGTVVFWYIHIYQGDALSFHLIFKWIASCIIASFFNESGWTILTYLREYIQVLMKNQSK